MHGELVARDVALLAEAGSDAGSTGEFIDLGVEARSVEGLGGVKASGGFLGGGVDGQAVGEPLLLFGEGNRRGALLAPEGADAGTEARKPHHDAEDGERDEEKFLAEKSGEEEGAEGADHGAAVAAGLTAPALKVVVRVKVVVGEPGALRWLLISA